MPFSNFTNPYQNSADVPDKYCKHLLTSKRFLKNGSYVNTKEDSVSIWTIEIQETEYGVPLKVIELEASATTNRTQQTSRVAFGRADLITKDDRYISSGSGLVEEVFRRRAEAKRLCTEAEALVTEAEALVKRMILGEKELA